MILESVPDIPAARPGSDRPLPLSARTDEAVQAQAKALGAWLADREPAGAAYTLATKRDSLDRRAVLVAGDRSELLGALDVIAAGDPTGEHVSGTAGDSGPTVFVFPGQGSQWPRMAVDLLAVSRVFAESFDPTAAALAGHLRSELFPEPTSGSVSALADLDRLAESVSTDHHDRARLAARLREILHRLEGTAEPLGHGLGRRDVRTDRQRTRPDDQSVAPGPFRRPCGGGWCGGVPGGRPDACAGRPRPPPRSGGR